MTLVPVAKPDLSRRYKGYVRIPPWAWECVCSDDDYDACWKALYATKRPGKIHDRVVSLRDPNLSERR